METFKPQAAALNGSACTDEIQTLGAACLPAAGAMEGGTTLCSRFAERRRCDDPGHYHAGQPVWAVWLPAEYRAPGRLSRPEWAITLDVRCAGMRSAGNPHSTCDVAGVGNGTPGLPPGHRVSSRPYHLWEIKSYLVGSKWVYIFNHQKSKKEFQIK